MKIKDIRKRVEDPFGALACGTVFTTRTDCEYFMKIEYITDGDDACNTVSLDNGELLFFGYDSPVIVLDCELTIK